MAGDYRPYLNSRTKDIALIGIRAAMEEDIETASYCFSELSSERRKRSDTAKAALELVFKLLGKEPIPWLEKAAVVTHSFVSNEEGNHYLYIILLSRIEGKKPGYGLYVGQSFRRPQERFEQHKKGRVESTKDRLPLRLIYYEACVKQEDALHRERYLKTYNGKRFLHKRPDKSKGVY